VLVKKSYPSSWVFTAMQSIHIRMNLFLVPLLKMPWIRLWRPQNSLALCRPFGPRSFKRFLTLSLDALFRNFCALHWVVPRKSASNRAPHLLRPALLTTSGVTCFMRATTPFRMRTIALAPSMDTVLHFNHITPCSEKWTANFAKILAAVVSMPAGR